MPRPDKAAALAELTAAFRGSSAAVLTEYRGLSVARLRELRRALDGQATYTVVKNTLTRIAVQEAGVGALQPLLEGPSAIAFVTGDPVIVVKGLRDFARANPLLVVKGGVVDGVPLSADEVRRLADLESREVLLSRLAGAMTTALSRTAALLQAPLAQSARLTEALREQRAEAGGDGSALVSGDGLASGDGPATVSRDGAAGSNEASDPAEADALAPDAGDAEAPASATPPAG